MKLVPINNSQKSAIKAINSPSNVVAILGGPGTGKSVTAVTGTIVRPWENQDLVESRGVRNNTVRRKGIVFVTATTKACMELADGFMSMGLVGDDGRCEWSIFVSELTMGLEKERLERYGKDRVCCPASIPAGLPTDRDGLKSRNKKIHKFFKRARVLLMNVTPYLLMQCN